MPICEYDEECKNRTEWEVGFTIIVHNSYMFEGSGKNEFQRFFCDKHLIALNGCGNVVEFREIGTEEWLDFSDYDNPYLLEYLILEKNIRKMRS